MASSEDETLGLKEGKEFYAQVREKSFYTLLERIITPIVTLLISIYIIRYLSVADFGLYNIMLAIMGYVALFSSFGLPNLFDRFIPEFFQKKDIARLKKFVDKGLILRFVVSIGIVLLLIYFADEVSRIFKLDNVIQYLKAFFLGIVFYLQTILLDKVLVSIFQHKQILIVRLIYITIRGTLLFLILSSGGGINGLLIGESIAYVVLFMLYQFYYQRFIKNNLIKKKVKLPLKRLLKFGGFSYFNEAGSKILSVSTDYFIISAFLGVHAVGIYGFASRLMFMITRIMPQVSFIKIIRPIYLDKYVQNKDLKQLRKMFMLLVKIIAFFSFPITTGILLLGDNLIIYVFGIKYIDSLMVVWIMALFFMVNNFQFPIALVLQSLEKVNILFYSKIFAVYNLVLDLIVVKTYGIVGIAIVTGSAVLFKWLFCYYFANKYVPLSFDLKRIGSICINCMVMAVPVYFLRNIIHNLVTLILVILLGVIVYLGASFFNKSFSPDERELLNKVLPKPIFIF